MATPQEMSSVLSGFPHPLTWGSFRRVKNSPSPPLQAHLSTSYRMGGWQVVVEKGAYRVRRFRIAVMVNAAASWATPAALSNMALLEHEQGHYDITGLVARDLARKLLDLELDAEVVSSLKDAGTTSAQHTRYAQQQLERSVDELGRNAGNLLAKLQSNPTTGGDGIYDTQTRHGLNQSAQATWNSRLARARQSNDDFGLYLAIAGVV